jgi:RHS repeat-associated protein
MDATNPDFPKVKTKAGVTPINGNGSATDANGNFVTKTIVSSTETDWKDSVGNTALKIFYSPSSTNPTSIQYEFLDGTGAYHTITLTLSGFNVKTNFACSGVGDYTSTSTINFPTELDIPTPGGSILKYFFTYELTPGWFGYITGRVKKVTLPTGGSYEYDYTGANNGINCADGSALGVNRVVTNGSDVRTWNFVRNTTSLTTTETTPQLADTSNSNNTVYTFNTLQRETQRKIYSDLGTTLLRTINTTWATNGTPATQVTILEDASSTQSQASTTYDGSGNLASLAEYDWGAGAHGPLIRTTSYNYMSTSPYTTRNILNLVSEKQITDANGVIQYRQDIAYDGSALTCPAGIAQHDDADYPCTMVYRGDPTSITTYKMPAGPSGGVTKNFTYDWFGNLLTADVNCCQKKTWTYSATTKYSQPDSVTSGSSAPQLTTSATYNQYTGQIATSTDENGQVTQYGYDFLRRPTSVQLPGTTTQITESYDDTLFASTVTTPIDSSKAVKQITAVDNLGYPILSTIEDTSSNVYSKTQAANNVLGRTYSTSNPFTGTSTSYFTTTTFDALGRPTQVKAPSPDASQTNYSYSANTLTVTDPASKKRKSVIDAAGRTTSVYEPDGSNNLTVQTSYTYTVLDGLTIVSEGSQTRSYLYDNLGRLTDRADPEIKNGTTQGHYVFQYNDYNLLTQRTDPRNVITTYGYDTLNRLRTISYSDTTAGLTLTYGTTPTANNNGRLITTADGPGSENYSYDVLGRVTQLQKVISGTTYTTGYQYNLASELTQITYPSGRIVQQAVDAIGRLCAVAQVATNCTTTTNPFANTYQYNQAFQLTSFNYANGVAATLGYSADRLQLTSLKYAQGATTLFNLTYSYGTAASNNGQITGITDNVDNGRSVTYGYDNLARLLNATTTGSTGYPKWGVAMAYDRYGNRTDENQTFGTPPTNHVIVDVNTNRLTTGYGYDANGNMTNDGSNTITYDAENRAITSSGGLGSGTYTYDGNNLRVKKLSGSTTTVYVFSGSSVIAEYVNGAAPTSPTREYIYSGSTLLAKVESGATQYYHADHLSTRLITNSSGTKIGEQGHYPFGESWYLTNTTTKWQFTDYERDAESGNDYAYARMYVSRLGRFSALDPMAGSVINPQSLNRYAYAESDPEDSTDPDGLCPNWYAKTFAPAGKVICTEAQPLAGREIVGWYALYDFSGWNPAGGSPDLGTWHPPYWDLLTISFFPIYGPSQNQSTGNGGNTSYSFQLFPGLKRPGQTVGQCMQQNKDSYSAGGAVATLAGGNQKVVDTANSVAGNMFLDVVYDGPQLAEGLTAFVKGMGAPLTWGRRTSDITALNLAGKGGLPQTLSASGKGARSLLGKLDDALSFGLTLAERAIVDGTFVVGEAIACSHQ